MIVEHSVRSTNDGLAITLRVVCQPEARLKIVLVSLNAFLQAQQVIRGQGQALRLCELGWEFHVVTHAEIQRQVRTNAPGVLPEKAQGNISERVARTTQSLDEVARQARAVRLHGREIGKTDSFLSGRVSWIRQGSKSEIC